MLKYYLSLCIFAFVWLNAASQVYVPTYSNEFLNIGAGARAMALGNAQLADPLPEEAGYWNPAFLTKLDSVRHISLMHSEVFGGVASYDYLAYAAALNKKVSFSLSLIRFGVDDIPDTRYIYNAAGRIDYSKIDFFSAADHAAIFSVGSVIEKWGNLAIGGNAKVIYRKAGDFSSAWGFGLDAGAQKQWGEYTLSLMLKDITSTFTVWNHSEELIKDVYLSTGNVLNAASTEITLPQAQLGVFRKIYVTDKFNVNGMAGLIAYFDGQRNTLFNSKLVSADPSLGLEMCFQNMVYLRTGISKWQKIWLTEEWKGEWSVGTGVDYKLIRFHYALNRNNGFEAANFTHTLSINLSIREE